MSSNPAKARCTRYHKYSYHCFISCPTPRNWQWMSGRLSTKLYDKWDGFNVSFVNFPFLCSNIPAAPVYGGYISGHNYVVKFCDSMWPFGGKRIYSCYLLLLFEITTFFFITKDGMQEYSPLSTCLIIHRRKKMFFWHFNSFSSVNNV